MLAMIVVKLMGGLGNQMFQYACGRALAIKHGVELKLDHSFLEDRKRGDKFTYRDYELNAFGIDRKASQEELNKIKFMSKLANVFGVPWGYKVIEENNPYEATTKFPNYSNLYLSGYFQSEAYFLTIEQTVRDDFTFVQPKNEYQYLIDHIGRLANPVGLLIRRDDYVSLKGEMTLKMDYYKKAVDIVKTKVPNPLFLIFTIGDTNWAKEQFRDDCNFEIVENANPNLCGFEKMRLMSLCKHNIIANSSFGWWGAWLNKNPNKVVITPKKWVNDKKADELLSKNRIPSKWIQI